MENIASEKEMKKKCAECSEVKSLMNFSKDQCQKDGLTVICKICKNKYDTKKRNTEEGYLKMRYNSLNGSKSRIARWGRKSKCHFTLDEFFAAFEKHKSIYGMRSAWGPGVDHLEQHLPITMIQKGKGRPGKRGSIKGATLIGSNLSVDRLDSNRDYTLQNIIFIRTDENGRKNNSSYEDCKIQIRLHEERFIKMKAI